MRRVPKYLTVACPRCKAQPGQLCRPITVGEWHGGEGSTRAHRQRHRAAAKR